MRIIRFQYSASYCIWWQSSSVVNKADYQSEGTGSNLGHCRNLSVACAPRAYPVNSAVNGCTGYFTWSQVGKVVMEKGGNRPYSASHEKSKAAILRFFHGFQLVQWPSGHLHHSLTSKCTTTNKQCALHSFMLQSEINNYLCLKMTF